MCKRAKRMVLKEMKGSYKDEYGGLWAYANDLRSTILDGTIILDVDRVTPNEPTTFRRFYVCFEACKKGWLNGCRPIISLDGCFLKGVCKGELLVAIGRDGNNKIFPIAWAVVEVEFKGS
ncbi:hypothetical protein CFOL_v3_23584 [Cephalotus follicularis]|uniref:MULE domain-containing protein n=1 Tax=Cephalotus follicularis TaxID=3775 RepID=A0A1Q3CJ34_CEPFO|nr:hypothetical protein CFOL_v3_23584 [Cephalotus follicularis]